MNVSNASVNRSVYSLRVEYRAGETPSTLLAVQCGLHYMKADQSLVEGKVLTVVLVDDATADDFWECWDESAGRDTTPVPALVDLTVDGIVEQFRETARFYDPPSLRIALDTFKAVLDATQAPADLFTVIDRLYSETPI